MNTKQQELLSRKGYLLVEEVEAAFPKLIHLRTAGKYDSDDLNIRLYYEPESGLFFEKAAYFRGDNLGFRVLDLQSEDDWKPWIQGEFEYDAFRKVVIHRRVKTKEDDK